MVGYRAGISDSPCLPLIVMKWLLQFQASHPSQLHSKQEARSSTGRGSPPLPPSYPGGKSSPSWLPAKSQGPEGTLMPAPKARAKAYLCWVLVSSAGLVNKEGKNNGFGANNKQSDMVISSLTYRWGDWTWVRPCNLPKVKTSKWQSRDSKLGSGCLLLHCWPLSDHRHPSCWNPITSGYNPMPPLLISCHILILKITILSVCIQLRKHSNFTQDWSGQPLPTHF